MKYKNTYVYVLVAVAFLGVGVFTIRNNYVSADVSMPGGSNVQMSSGSGAGSPYQIPGPNGNSYMYFPQSSSGQSNAVSLPGTGQSGSMLSMGSSGQASTAGVSQAASVSPVVQPSAVTTSTPSPQMQEIMKKCTDVRNSLQGNTSSNASSLTTETQTTFDQAVAKADKEAKEDWNKIKNGQNPQYMISLSEGQIYTNRINQEISVGFDQLRAKWQAQQISPVDFKKIPCLATLLSLDTSDLIKINKSYKLTLSSGQNVFVNIGYSSLNVNFSNITQPIGMFQKLGFVGNSRLFSAAGKADFGITIGTKSNTDPGSEDASWSAYANLGTQSQTVLFAWTKPLN